jgi:hypothetical protein
MTSWRTHPMSGYDHWLEAPYVEAYEKSERYELLYERWLDVEVNVIELCRLGTVIELHIETDADEDGEYESFTLDVRLRSGELVTGLSPDDVEEL